MHGVLPCAGPKEYMHSGLCANCLLHYCLQQLLLMLSGMLSGASAATSDCAAPPWSVCAALLCCWSRHLSCCGAPRVGTWAQCTYCWQVYCTCCWPNSCNHITAETCKGALRLYAAYCAGPGRNCLHCAAAYCSRAGHKDKHHSCQIRPLLLHSRYDIPLECLDD